jgi:endonuclease YncB( thermonuclease family)
VLLAERGCDLKINGTQLRALATRISEKKTAGIAAGAGLVAILTAQSYVSGGFAKEAISNPVCVPKAASQATVVSVNDRLELTLTDGRVLRIAGLEAAGPTPSDPDLGLRGRDWLAAWLENRDILYQALDSRPDRWGRYTATVFAAPVSGEAPLSSAGERLAGQGFARVVPDQYKNPCEKRLLQAEKPSRDARLGLWNDPYYEIIAATDTLAFTEHAGSLVLAEGRVTDVRDGAGRTTLFFGPQRRNHLAVTVLQRNVKIFETAGLHFHDLIGQTLRVRGVLETHFGPEIEVTNPGEVELIADGPSETIKPRQTAPVPPQQP